MDNVYVFKTLSKFTRAFLLCMVEDIRVVRERERERVGERERERETLRDYVQLLERVFLRIRLLCASARAHSRPRQCRGPDYR